MGEGENSPIENLLATIQDSGSTATVDQYNEAGFEYVNETNFEIFNNDTEVQNAESTDALTTAVNDVRDNTISEGESIINSSTFTTATTEYGSGQDAVYTAESVRIPLNNYSFLEDDKISDFKVTAYINGHELATNTLSGNPSTSTSIYSPFNFNQGTEERQVSSSDCVVEWIVERLNSQQKISHRLMVNILN